MALSANRISGVTYVKADGVSLTLRGSLTVSPDMSERNGVAGMDGVHGYIETQRVPYIEGDFSDSGGMSLTAIAKIDEATVTAELANGKTYILRRAWTATARELNAAEGTVSIRFEGRSSAEMMP